MSFHSLRVEGDRSAASAYFRSLSISIHSLRAEGDRNKISVLITLINISIHSLRAEGDLKMCVRYKILYDNFNPLPPCGGRPRLIKEVAAMAAISIHSLRAEGDISMSTPELRRTISIHSLRAEGDSGERRRAPPRFAFQSTPSVRRETDFSPVATLH